jgi:hypothetical protein
MGILSLSLMQEMLPDFADLTAQADAEWPRGFESGWVRSFSSQERIVFDCLDTPPAGQMKSTSDKPGSVPPQEVSKAYSTL